MRAPLGQAALNFASNIINNKHLCGLGGLTKPIRMNGSLSPFFPGLVRVFKPGKPRINERTDEPMKTNLSPNAIESTDGKPRRARMWLAVGMLLTMVFAPFGASAQVSSPVPPNGQGSGSSQFHFRISGAPGAA